jgi:mono/diheme cytochrome c family protein
MVTVMQRMKVYFLTATILACASLACTSGQIALAADKKSDEMAGALLFRDQNCAHCHMMNGAGGIKGPDLTNINTDKDWTAEKITGQITNGGQKMPPFADALTDVQIGQIVAYLRAKHRPVPPAATATPQ